VVARLILVRRVNIPAPSLLAVHTDEVPFPNIVCKVILCDIATVRELERFILDLCCIDIQSEIRQLLVLIGVVAVRETTWVETPQCSEDRKVRQRFVDEVLVRAC
jgi:hypothetical protein